MKGQWGKIVGWFIGIMLITAVITIGSPMIGGPGWLPDSVARETTKADQLWWGLIWVSIVIFTIVSTVVIYCIVHFRAKDGDEGDGAHIQGDMRMELGWIIVPTIIVTALSFWSWVVLEDNEIGLYDVSKANSPGAATMQVDVRGFSFGWAFRYKDMDGTKLTPNAVESTPELVLPLNAIVRFNVMACSGTEKLGRVQEEVTRRLEAGKETRFSTIKPSLCERHWDLTTPEAVKDAKAEAETLFYARKKIAKKQKLNEEEQKLIDEQPTLIGDMKYLDVNHAFWVPETRLKIDAVAGLRTFVQWTPNKITGPNERYEVVCAELCGAGHASMRTALCVVDEATFEWWVSLKDNERADAKCANLRLMNCLDKPSDYNATLEKIAKLTSDKPTASCNDAKEVVAA